MNNASAPAPSEVGSVATMSVAAEEPHYASLVPENTVEPTVDTSVEAQADDTIKWCSGLKEQVT